MFSRTVKCVRRILNLASVVSVVLSAMCPGGQGWAQTPAAAKPTTGAAAAPAGPNRAECARYVEALAGKKADRKLLEKADLQALASQVPELVTCGAVAADSEELCKLVSQWKPCPGCEVVGKPAMKGQERALACHRMRFIFHELRSNPKGRSFMLPFTREECSTLKQLAPDCTTFVDVLRSGDLDKCASAGAFQSLCRAFITLDKSHCGSIQGLPEDLPSACKEIIDQRGFLGKGLKALAESGPPRDPVVQEYFGDPDELKTLAQAALGGADACRALATAATEQCMASAPKEAGAAASTPASAKPAP